MKRSNNTERNQKLNKALELLSKGYEANHAAVELVGQFGISSSRQAYRYLQKAQRMEHSIPIAEPTIPITIKIPKDVALKLRTYAQTSDLTIGEIVRRAVLTFLVGEGYHG